MKHAFILSDIHCDFLIKGDLADPAYDAMEFWLEEWFAKANLPKTEAIIIPGDIANDFNTFSHFLKFISGKYEDVYMCLGNHDLVIRGGTPSQSNLKFIYSSQRVELQKAEAAKYPNVHLLDGDVMNGIGGTMGMCDFEYRPILTVDYFLFWSYHWFDGKHWRLDNPPIYNMWRDEKKKLEEIVAKQPKIVFTHFSPVEIGVEFEYRNDVSSCFFFFNGEEFLEKMPNDSYWICGHSHTSVKKDYVCKNGNVVHLLRNPWGYPGEDCLADHNLKKEDFIIPLPE